MKFTKFARFTKNFRIHQNSPNRTKIFKDATYQRPYNVVILGIRQHGYRVLYSGKASGGRD